MGPYDYITDPSASVMKVHMDETILFLSRLEFCNIFSQLNYTKQLSKKIK